MFKSRKIDIAIPQTPGWLQELVDATAPQANLPRRDLACPGIRILSGRLAQIESHLRYFYYKIDGQVMVFDFEHDDLAYQALFDYMAVTPEPLASFFVLATYSGPGTRTDGLLVLATGADEYVSQSTTGRPDRGLYVEKLRSAAAA